MYLIQGTAGFWEDAYEWFAKNEDNMTYYYTHEDEAEAHCKRLNDIIDKLEPDSDFYELESDDDARIHDCDEFSTYFVVRFDLLNMDGELPG